jgi:hypothetical protein
MDDAAAFENLLQIMSLLVDRLGGEVIFSKEEFACYKTSKVLMRYISEDYVRLRISVPEVVVLEDIDRTPPSFE